MKDEKDYSGLLNLPDKIGEISEYYDNWAKEYNDTLKQWNYKAPENAAAIISSSVPVSGEILDAGCGTGLVGSALAAQGFTKIDGIDLSAESLIQASKASVYRSLHEVNMKELPLPIDSNTYDGLLCVGVLTYLPDSTSIISEFSRIVKPGGIVAITQRDDIFNEREFDTVLDKLVEKKVIADLKISEPLPYLPENDDFGDEILVQYISFKAA